MRHHLILCAVFAAIAYGIIQGNLDDYMYMGETL